MTDVISADRLSVIDRPPWSEECLTSKAAYRVAVAVAGLAMTIRFDDASCAALFAARYEDLLVEEVAGLVHYVVKTEAGYVFWSGAGGGWSWEHGPLSVGAVAFLADATAIATLIRSSSQLVSFHAAAIAYDGIAAAIAGDSNAGKTTTAIACARRGMRLYSDERCIMRDRLVVPFPRTLNIRGDGLRLLAQDDVHAPPLPVAPLQVRDDRKTVPVRISALFGANAIPAPARLRAVFVLSGRAEKPRLEPVEWFEAAAAVMRWMESGERGLERGGRLVQALRDVWCFRLVLGSPDASALLVRSALAELVSDHAG